MNNYQAGRPAPSNADAYGLRRHNRRIGNPETRTRSKLYYETRFYARALVRIVVGLFWLGVFVGIFYAVYLVLASIYGG